MRNARFVVALCAIALFAASRPASATTLRFESFMVGSNEVPPNGSPATGFAVIEVDDVANTLLINMSWAGLIGGNPAAAHIHCCTPPGANATVAIGFPSFPATTSGTYSQLFDLTNIAIYNVTFRNTFGGGTAAGSEAALIAGLQDGLAYTNIHNATFPGGEIRGQVAETPEPASLVLLGTGLAAALRARRKKA